MYSVFHSCQYGGLRKKKTMLAFNADEFLAVSAMCPGQSSRHKHARWGLNATNGFATADETAYPMGLARLIAVVFTRVLLRCGIHPLADTLEQVQPCSLQALQKIRASVGHQARSSRIPPLVRTYKQRFKIQGPKSVLPKFSVLQRTKTDVLLVQEPKQWLPKGSRLLAIEHVSSQIKGGLSAEETGGPGHVHECNDEISDGQFSTIFDNLASNATTAGNSSLECNAGNAECNAENSECNVAISDNHFSTSSDTFENNVATAFTGEFLQTLTLKAEDSSVAEDWQLQVWGTPWTPDEFVDMAVVAGHPAKLHSSLPPMLMDCIGKSLMKSCSQRMAHRAQALKYWLRRSLQLKRQEEELAQTLEPGVAEVLQGKRILVWKEMLQSINYSDMGVVDEFRAGSKLTGQTDLTNLWPSKITPATMTERELHAQARLQRDGLSFGQVVFFDSEIAHSVWDQTLQEVSRGEAEGPFDLSEVPSHFPPCRRFGVKQSGKIRCVDDFSWPGINAASQPRESPKPHTLDVVAAMISAVMCHAEGGHAWLSRSFDLKNAYRQCAVHPESRQFSYIVVGDPNTSSLKAFRLKALPFGSVKSVHSFLRIAHSLWAILTSIFWVITTNYFDDFVSIAESREAASVDYTVKAVFRLLGWRFAEDGPKAPPFSNNLVALGVEFDVSRLHQGLVKVANTESRREELAQSLDQAVASKSLAKLEALRLRGRMQFASGEFYGRLARRCLAVVTQHAYSSESSTLSEAAAHALSRFRDMLVNGAPRMISSKSTTTWFLFTDAWHEPDESEPFSGVGGVLVDQLGCRRRFFSERLPPDLLRDINVSRRKTIIYECEFFSVLCAMTVWKEFLHQCNVVIHTDSDAVRDAFIACHTSSTNSLPILDAILRAENDAECNSWITRVPTESNISDDPSRLQIDHLMSCGCLRDSIDCATIWLNTVCKPGHVSKRGGDRPALHTPLDKRPHCERGSSQENLSKQDRRHAN